MGRTRKAGFAPSFWENLQLDGFWELGRKGKKGIVKKRKIENSFMFCTESEEHERVMEQREGLGKEKCRARETRQHLLTEMSPCSVLPGMNSSLSKAKINSSVLVLVADVPWDLSKSLLPAVSQTHT